jgi:hypothetical protein
MGKDWVYIGEELRKWLRLRQRPLENGQKMDEDGDEEWDIVQEEKLKTGASTFYLL